MELIFSNNLCSAFIAEVVRVFNEMHPGNYLGRTALQKLTYFSQALGVPIPCSFEIYNYGPYSDEVKFSVDSLLADEVLADTSSAPSKYSNYRLRYADVKFDGDIEAKVNNYRPKIENVVEILGGFKPEQLELIATLHFIAARTKTLSQGPFSKTQVISEFFRIKGNKFPANEVTSWFDSLKEAKLI